jgi:hypothetical protein
MSIVTLDQAKAQGRITWASEDVLLQGYLDAAERHCCNFLNRNVYADQTALDAARATAPAALSAAAAAYDAAYTAWQAMVVGTTSTTDLAALAFEKLSHDWNEAKKADRAIWFGMVANETFIQAVILLFAGWAVNREYVITELSNAIELPFGVTALLFPDRVQQGV